ncbi:MAG: hypothetical protein IPK82_03955 [Polyangiaceae bacterium]|nr:hypothetical protein [Polyangiaceae bacterium]
MTQVDAAPTMVLLIDDQLGDLAWLADRIEQAGLRFRFATNEEDARERLYAVASGDERYLFAVVDVMMAVTDILRVHSLDDDFFEESRDSGIRLCRYAREELKITPENLPIAVYTARPDNEVRKQIAAIEGVQFFPRDGSEGEGSLSEFVERQLARIGK